MDGVLIRLASDGLVLMKEKGSKEGVDEVVPHLRCIGSGMMDGCEEVTCTPLLVLCEQDWNGGCVKGTILKDKTDEL